MTNKGGWIGFDLDGTLAHYDKWDGGKIGEPIKPMIDKVCALLDKNVKVKIFTARVADKKIETVRAIEQWCMEHIGVVLPITNVKDMSMIALYDDRAIAVEKNTGAILGGVEPYT